MAVPVIETGWSTDTGLSTTDRSLTMPTSLATNDLCIIIVGSDDVTDTAQWDDSTLKPTGFTLINYTGSSTPDAHVASFYRVITGAESWPIAVPSAANLSSVDEYAFAIRVTGADTSTPLHLAGADYEGGSAGSHAITGLTTTLDDCLVMFAFAFDGDDGTPYVASGTGYTKSAELTSGSAGNGVGGAFGSRDLATQGASGAVTISITGTSDGASGHQFAIAPAAGSNITIEVPSGPVW